tara:strand:+ start:3702 stop:4355 length:654 start_codon:yes stop_codon:yes gene_type:complete
MPLWINEETNTKLFQVHIPRTAGRYIGNNLSHNGFGIYNHTNDEIINDSVMFDAYCNSFDRTADDGGVQLIHWHKEIYSHYFDLTNIPQISIVRDPIDRYKSVIMKRWHDDGKMILPRFTHDNWFRPQSDYISEETNIWKFEDGFDNKFWVWLSNIVGTKITEKTKEFDGKSLKLSEDVLYKIGAENHKEHQLVVDNKILDQVKLFYKDDFDIIQNL